MPVFKNENNNTWYVMARYTDWKGERKQKCKRGFQTRREAQEWEHTFQMQMSSDMDMSFEAFAELYARDIKPRLKETTWLTKEHIIRTKLLPCFGKRKLSEISTKDVIAWQNELLAHRDEQKKSYSAVYLKTMHNQPSAIFNHAVRFYGLRNNPAAQAGNMGTEQRKEMLFWTKEEYQRFAEAMMDKPASFYAFEMLYWCGIREGELLALTPADFDFENGTVRINKSYQRVHVEDVITTPKTKKSNRTIKMPQFLCEEMQDYLKILYDLKKKDRIFTITKSYLHHEMDRGAKEAGVKRIRIRKLMDVVQNTLPTLARTLETIRRDMVLLGSHIHRAEEKGNAAKERLDKIQTDYDSYLAVRRRIAQKLDARKAVRQERDKTPLLNISRRLELSSRISGLTKDIESLKVEEQRWIRRFGQRDSAGMKTVQKQIEEMEKTVQQYGDEANTYVFRMDESKARFANVKQEASRFDQDEIIAERLNVRREIAENMHRTANDIIGQQDMRVYSDIVDSVDEELGEGDMVRQFVVVSAHR